MSSLLRTCPTVWLGSRRGYASDWSTQLWVAATGTVVRRKDAPWLDGPAGRTRRIGTRFIAELAAEEGLVAVSNRPGSGLSDLENLRGTGFDTDRIHPRIRDFYARTSAYGLDLWSSWDGVFQPFGWAISFFFSRRLSQLNMPLDPLEAAHGLRSRIVQLVEPESGCVRYTAWERRYARGGGMLYCGLYSVTVPPRLGRPCVKVVFPLPNGSATVLLRPEVRPDGSLDLISEGEGIGDTGFYFLVRRDADSWHVRRLDSMKEQLHVYVDRAGVLRTDHVFRLWGLRFLRLHYRMVEGSTDSTQAPKPR